MSDATYDDGCGFDPPPPQPTLRDRFAMAALTGLLAGEQWYTGELDDAVECSLSLTSYRLADAMLAARNNETP